MLGSCWKGGNIAGALFAHIIAVRPSTATLHKYWLTGSSFADKNVLFFNNNKMRDEWIRLGVFFTFYVHRKHYLKKYVCTCQMGSSKYFLQRMFALVDHFCRQTQRVDSSAGQHCCLYDAEANPIV